MQTFRFGKSLEKIVLGFVLVVLVLGFFFSGSSSVFSSHGETSEVQVGQKTYFPGFFKAFKRVISLEGTFGYALNDRVIAKDFFRSGLADVLFESDRSIIYDQMVSNIEKEKKWRPYRSPVLDEISLEGIWRHSAPNLSERWEEFRNICLVSESEQVSPDQFFKRKADLYVAQSFFTDEDFRCFLSEKMKYETDAEVLQKHLDENNLHFFGYVTSGEWFGDHFVDLVARCILRGAEAARREGIVVTLEESKADLWARATLMANRFTNEEQKVEAKSIFQSFSTFSGLSHARLIELWSEVMLFRKLIARHTSPIVLDSTLFQQVGQFATEGHRVVRYAIEPGIFLRVPEQQFLFHLYCSKIDPDWFEHDSLPKRFLSVEEVKKDYPELIGFHCKARYRILRQDALTQVSPLKELWTWQISDEHWDFVLEQAPQLHKMYGPRLDRLFSLDDRERVGLDLACLAEMIKEDPSMVERFLEECSEDSLHNLELGLCHPESPFNFLGEKKEEFFALVEQALAGDQEARQKLKSFSPDGKNFVRIDPEERGEDYILTFSQARTGGALETIKKRELTAYMKKRRIKSMEKAEASYWKRVFKDVPSEDIYKKHRRHFNYLREVRALLQSGDRHLVFNREDKDKISDFDKQWLLITLEKDILRSQEKVYYELPTFFEEGSKWSEPVASIAGWLLFDELVEVLPGGLLESEKIQNSVVDLRAIIVSHLSSSLLRDWFEQELAERGPLIEAKKEETS
ncbi:hypothetical protein [Candidatus Similichlamydia laticola]|uniref:Uncharacterized protein n=1 Tax=Candidatus Similichlamydia laticola TaxID=2170265 RepID=A0A369KHV9_9BACT|nr:hypothetical protein [Candidatus Similichlamydia laticola]RDB31354.1 hypothetical protein HAT2_00541 [Candidatus Similichlamydia laticola]